MAAPEVVLFQAVFCVGSGRSSVELVETSKMSVARKSRLLPAFSRRNFVLGAWSPAHRPSESHCDDRFGLAYGRLISRFEPLESDLKLS